MPKENNLEKIFQLTLNSLKEQGYSNRTLSNYQKRFKTLSILAQKHGITEPCEKLFQLYLADNINKYTGNYSILKERQHIRVVNLIRFCADTGTADVSRRKGKSVSDTIKSSVFKDELDRFVFLLIQDGIKPNTLCTYKRIVAYFLVYCEEKCYTSLNMLVPGDIRDFILYLYDHGYFRPTTITSGLSGFGRFLSMHDDIKHLAAELPSRLPRERKIIEIYDGADMKAIDNALSTNVLSKRDRAICQLLLETGLRGVDICNIKLSDIDWKKDVIYITQQKTGIPITLPLRPSYGNAIADYILYERPKVTVAYLFLRESAPYSRLNGEGASIRVVLQKMEAAAGISKARRETGSRTTRHNAASTMLKAGVPLADISAVLGHTDPNVVTVYLSTDESVMASCTLPLPGGAGR